MPTVTAAQFLTDQQRGGGIEALKAAKLPYSILDSFAQIFYDLFNIKEKTAPTNAQVANFFNAAVPSAILSGQVGYSDASNLAGSYISTNYPDADAASNKAVDAATAPTAGTSGTSVGFTASPTYMTPNGSAQPPATSLPPGGNNSLFLIVGALVVAYFFIKGKL